MKKLKIYSESLRIFRSKIIL